MEYPSLRRVAKRALARLTANNYRPLNRIELSRSRTLRNVALLQTQHPGKEIVPVLKGNAYGHGLREMASILNGATCNYLAVDGYFEAATIRDISKQHIIVMGYILPQNVRLLDTKRCSFVVQDIAGLKAFGSLRGPVRIHMEINTGMNRLGLQIEEVPDYLEELKKHPNLHLEGVMTHLADADNERDDAFTHAQVEVFDRQVSRILAAGFNPKLIHIAQTAGSTKAASRYANAIRLGIGLYGVNPLGDKDAKQGHFRDLKPVLELKSTIIKVLDLQKGDKVSYNCTFVAPRAMRVGVLPLGYYEGVPRELSSKGFATVGAHKLPIVGRVCMDHTMIDLGASGLQAGDEVTVLSREPAAPNSVAGLSREHKLFAYTTLTGLSSSVARVIVA
ncbi:MAG TPA: alanine racemase [Candidatus Saccharimonadales bacterium]